MFGFGRFLAVGAVFGIVAAVLVCVSKYRNRTTDVVSSLNDKLVVSRLTGTDITNWFQANNPSNEYVSVVMLVNNGTLSKLKLSAASLRNFESMLLEHKNVILQAILDKNNDSIVLTRAIIFNEMEEGLANLLNSHHGFVVIN